MRRRDRERARAFDDVAAVGAAAEADHELADGWLEQQRLEHRDTADDRQPRPALHAAEDALERRRARGVGPVAVAARDRKRREVRLRSLEELAWVEAARLDGERLAPDLEDDGEEMLRLGRAMTPPPRVPLREVEPALALRVHPASMTRAQRPRNCGFRFSPYAFRPSLASLDAKSSA